MKYLEWLMNRGRNYTEIKNLANLVDQLNCRNIGHIDTHLKHRKGYMQLTIYFYDTQKEYEYIKGDEE